MHSEKNGILPGVLKNNSNGSRPLFRHHGRQNIFQMLKENKNRLSTQKPTLNKNMLSSRGKKKKRFRDEGMLKRIVNNRQSLKKIVLTKQGNKTKPLVNTLSLSLRLTIKAESYIWEILKAWRATGGGGFCTTVRRQDLSGGSIH